MPRCDRRGRLTGRGRGRRLALVFMVILTVSTAMTVPADPLESGKSTIDGGGTIPTSGGTFVLGGTVGQHDAGSSAAGAFTLVGGFWSGGAGSTTSAEESPSDSGTLTLPQRFVVYPTSPNPTGRETQVRFDTPEPAFARVRVYDLSGSLVRTLTDGVVPAGRHSAVWEGDQKDGRRASAGLYFLRIEIGEYRGTQKVVVVR